MPVTYYVALPFVRTEDGPARRGAGNAKRSSGDPACRGHVAGSILCRRTRVQAFGRWEVLMMRLF
jgi:hypothetical protein